MGKNAHDMVVRQRVSKFLEQVIYWGLVLLPFSVSIAPAPTSIVIAIVFTAYFTRKFLTGERIFPRISQNGFYLAFFLISCFTIVKSVDYQSSLRGVLKLVQNWLLVLVFVDTLKDREHAKKILISLIAGACFASLDALWQTLTGRDFIRGHELILNIGLKRATGAFPNANVLGVYLSPVASLAFGLGLYRAKGRMRWLLLTAGMLICSAIILTFSRPAALAAVLAIFLLAILKGDKLALAFIGLVLVLGVVFCPANIKNWAREQKYNPVVLMCNTDRLSIYRNSLNMIKHNPWLGVGLNTFSARYGEYKLPEPPGAESGHSVYAHNNFLHMAGEVGLLGLTAFLFLLYSLFSGTIKGLRRARHSFDRDVILLLIISMFAFLINGLTETSLYYARVSLMFWYYCGFALAISFSPRLMSSGNKE